MALTAAPAEAGPAVPLSTCDQRSVGTGTTVEAVLIVTTYVCLGKNGKYTLRYTEVTDNSVGDSWQLDDYSTTVISSSPSSTSLRVSLNVVNTAGGIWGTCYSRSVKLILNKTSGDLITIDGSPKPGIPCVV